MAFSAPLEQGSSRDLLSPSPPSSYKRQTLTLSNLRNEVIGEIASYLDSASLCTFRDTSAFVKRQIHHNYSRQHPEWTICYGRYNVKQFFKYLANPVAQKKIRHVTFDGSSPSQDTNLWDSETRPLIRIDYVQRLRVPRKLVSLTLTDLSVHEDDLFILLYRHRGALRRLSLHNVHIHNPSRWEVILFCLATQNSLEVLQWENLTYENRKLPLVLPRHQSLYGTNVIRGDREIKRITEGYFPIWLPTDSWLRGLLIQAEYPFLDRYFDPSTGAVISDSVSRAWYDEDEPEDESDESDEPDESDDEEEEEGEEDGDDDDDDDDDEDNDDSDEDNDDDDEDNDASDEDDEGEDDEGEDDEGEDDEGEEDDKDDDDEESSDTNPHAERNLPEHSLQDQMHFDVGDDDKDGVDDQDQQDDEEDHETAEEQDDAEDLANDYRTLLRLTDTGLRRE